MKGDSLLSQGRRTGAPSGAFEVWVEVRCSTCPEQIAGVYATHSIPHREIEEAGRRAGAVLVDGRWICRCCAGKILERKRAAQGRK